MAAELKRGPEHVGQDLSPLPKQARLEEDPAAGQAASVSGNVPSKPDPSDLLHRRFVAFATDLSGT